MNIIGAFVQGLFSVLQVTSAPMLYRYPYRTSAEGLRADWNSIGQDIENVIGKLEEETQHGSRL
jgi:hypothetical protein